MAIKNTRKNYFQELAGLRVVKMFIEEYFHWGFQLIDQENDDGLDGIIIIRDKNGSDMGTRIHCQIKCGPSFLKSQRDGFLYLQPYSPKERLHAKLEHYSKMTEPTVLFYINTGKILPDGRTEFDKRNPPCWWLRLDNYVHDGTSQIKIPESNNFGEHSKGDLFNMVKPLLKNWNNFPLLEMDEVDKKLWYSLRLAEDAKAYYTEIKEPGPIKLLSNGRNVYFTRIGWRHINKKSRGSKRISNSLRLLSIARRVLEKHSQSLIFLREKETYTQNCYERYYGIRLRVKIDGQEKKVQVILRNWLNPIKQINKFWFYSVHIIK